MEQSEIQKLREKEFNFLKDELEKIDSQIKAHNYDKWADLQGKLWELREKIKTNLDKFIKEYPALFK
ncbi:hypothetical protein KJ813_05615 [bacterium]|nr:hypothetical protein [bacterium]MBU4362120.1 hypothetical protein [bacterium]MCG2821445.1 hypothetical protein [Candidatus Atribacteria bacterium]